MSITALATPSVSSRLRWYVLAIILVADVMDLLDATITNVAAPTIVTSLHAGNSLIPWLGASYAVTLGSLLIIGGRLGDHFGRREMLLLGLAGFVAASVLCGLATTPTVLIGARLIQGVFGALMIPQGFGILAAVFPGDQLGKAFSLFAPVMGLSAVGGPMLAGVLIDSDLLGLSWRPIFLINIVLGLGALAAALKLVPRGERDRNASLDLPGSFLIAIGMIAVLAGLIELDGTHTRARAAVLLAGGAITLAGFVWRQRTAANPLIVPTLFGNRGFVSGLILGVVFFAAVAGLLYIVSLYVQLGLHYSALRAALTLAPVAAGIVLASVASYRLIATLGRRLIGVGVAVVLVGVAGLIAVLAGYDGAAPAGCFRRRCW